MHNYLISHRQINCFRKQSLIGTIRDTIDIFSFHCFIHVVISMHVMFSYRKKNYINLKPM